jgi:hypothetical protein
MKLPALIAMFLVAALSWPLAGQDSEFIRADSNLSGTVDISDAVFTLGVLFLGQGLAGCDDAMDANDDGGADISDASYTLNYLFTGGAAPPAPFPDCGPDLTADDLGCDLHPECGAAPECFDQQDLDQAIEENVPSEVCIPPDAAQIVFEILLQEVTVTVCPADLAGTCGDGEGCPVAFDVVEGTLDVAAELVTVHVEGEIVGLPILLEGPAGNQVCTNDITFSGDVLVPFITERRDEGLVLVELLQPTLAGDPEITLEARENNLICNTLESMQDQFMEDLVAQLEASAGELLVDLNAELAGSILCE